jgi:hypothetical protein
MAQVIEAKKDAAARQPPPLRFSRVFHARREPTLFYTASDNFILGESSCMGLILHSSAVPPSPGSL